MLDRAHPDQAVEDGDTKEGDESDPGRDRERQSAEKQRKDPACRRHRNGRVDEEGQPQRVKRTEKRRKIRSIATGTTIVSRLEAV